MSRSKSNVLAISDIHAPYHHKHTIDFLVDTARRYKCTEIVDMGDLFDIHRTSRHTPEPESYGITEELERARIFVKELALAFPKMKIAYGNHDMRIVKVGKLLGIPAEAIKSPADLFECPKSWVWGKEHSVDEVIYFHGDGYSGSQGALNAAINKRSSVVIGHIHSFGGVLYQNNGYNKVFGLNTGCLIDQNSPAFRYAETSKNKATIGCGVVIEGVEAHFIPM